MKISERAAKFVFVMLIVYPVGLIIAGLYLKYDNWLGRRAQKRREAKAVTHN